MNQWLYQLNQLEPWRIMRQDLNHLYLRPHPALKEVVAHYTITFPQGEIPLEARKEGKMLTLLPDISGCFVFAMGSKGRFWGPTTKAVQVPVDFNEAPIRFFVEFLPGGASCVTGFAMGQLADEIWEERHNAPFAFEQLQSFLEADLPLPLLLQKTDTLLLSQLARHNKADRKMLMAMLKHSENMRVSQMADAVGYSQRHLQRLFLENFGVGVKACARVVRINNTLARITPQSSLAELAQQSGYYDQAHFNHDFKQICGVTPTEYLQRMSEFYKEEYKF